MIIKYYSVLDNVAQMYFPPTPQHNDGSAVRSFVEACKDSASVMGKRPGDYAIYYVGQFDDQNGVFVSVVDDRKVPFLLLSGQAAKDL